MVFLKILYFNALALSYNFAGYSLNQEEQNIQDETARTSGKRIELIRADYMEFDKDIGDNARRLLGNVVFKHEDTYMHCDSAYLYSDKNVVEAFSNIHIMVSDTVDIFGQRLYYDGNTRMAELHENVIMRDEKMTLTTEHLFYDLNENTANYYDGGKIVDKDNVLTSIWGFYYSDLKHFHFRDDVRLINPEYVMESDTLKYNTETEIAYFFGPTSITSEENIIFCKNGWYDTKNDVAQFKKDAFIHNQEHSITGDSLFYDRKLGYGKALNNVVMEDTIQNVIITGHFGEHFEKKGLSVVTEEAVLTMVSDNDSLFLHADTLKYVFEGENNNNQNAGDTVYVKNNSELPDEVDKNGNNEPKEDVRKLFAYNRAKFYRSDMQGMSDSIVYSFSDSTIYMFHNPILWSEEHQITANTIEIETWDDIVHSVKLVDAAFIISEEDTLKYNQIKGREVIGYFKDNQLYRIDVFGNGETLYYVRDDEEKLIGVNKAISSSMIIYVDENQIDRIIFVDNPDATLHSPGRLSSEEKLLNHFRWFDDIRPKRKEDIFIWNYPQ